MTVIQVGSGWGLLDIRTGFVIWYADTRGAVLKMVRDSM